MKKLSVYQMATTAIMAALLCILGPMTIPIGPVPISLAILVVCLSVLLLGTKLGTLSVVIYLLLGLVGVPVFSGYSAGFAKLAGPTGGYLIGYIFTALIAGLFFEKSKENKVMTAIGMVLGVAAAYLLGTAWFVISLDCELAYALSVCVIPFIPFDAAKIVIAMIVGYPIRNALRKAGLLVGEASVE